LAALEGVLLLDWLGEATASLTARATVAQKEQRTE
jgi:hypothetical protein